MIKRRSYFFLIVFLGTLGGILARLFYWQILRGSELATLAQRQRLKVVEVVAPRGKVYTADQFPLVLNKPSFSLYAYLPNLKENKETLSKELAPLVVKMAKESTESAEILEKIKSEKEALLVNELLERLNGPNQWIILARDLNELQKEEIEKLDSPGLGFEIKNARDYPEASMAAHLLGFVGSDKNGRSKGYFGIEGYYHSQLSGAPGLIVEEKGILGETILAGKRFKENIQTGLNLSLNIDRTVQYILETELLEGLRIHGAKSGWGIILEPETGKVIAMAGYPNYAPQNYQDFTEELFPNPVIALGFEPGSIFKPIIMAAALEENVLGPDSKCSYCSGPRTIGEYTIRTWNDQYFPNSTMAEVIQHSDNIGMVFVAEEMGKERMLETIKKFGFGEKTGIDLQEEAALPLRNDNQWYPIDIATLSFGQGILTTPIQVIRAFNTLAQTEGRLVEPRVVDRIWENENQSYEIKGTSGKKILSSKTRDEMRKMLVNAVENGEAKWAKPENLSVAGKTGTAQIPIEGHYDEEKTIASFIGYAPADNPKFVMLISLREPASSPWGSETAAPVWFNIAGKLAYYWGLN